MTLQSSSTTHPQMLLPTISNTDEPVVVDTTVNHKQQKSKEDHRSLCDCPNTPLSHAESAAIASPCVSAVIDALHLSDIDWDALSFTSSPPPQSAANHTTEPKLSKTTDREVKGTENTKQKASSDVKEADSRSATELSYTECPLRDRVLIRNTAKAIDQMEVHNHDVVSKQLNYELATLIHTSSHNSNHKPNGQNPSKGGNDNELPGKESALNVKEPLTDNRQYATNKAESETQNSRQQLRPAVQAPSKTNNKYNASQKPPQKFTFARTAISSLVAPPQRYHSDPGQREKNVLQTTKKSVCMSMASSSEESDTENQQFGPERKAKIKPINKIKGHFPSDFPLKPVSGPKTTKPKLETAHTVRLLPLKPQSCSVDIDINSVPVSTKSICQDVSPANEKGDVFLQNPASPVAVLDSDDSVICSDSPLPLAERLRLKFLK